MKKFVKTWKASKLPKKQRKYIAKAPLHIKQKMVGANLSRELRKEIGLRTIPVKKGDTVKILRGQYKGKTGKVEKVNLTKQRVFVAGAEFVKKNGSKSMYPLTSSSLQITKLNNDDKRRIKKSTQTKKTEDKKEKQ